MSLLSALRGSKFCWRQFHFAAPAISDDDGDEEMRKRARACDALRCRRDSGELCNLDARASARFTPLSIRENAVTRPFFFCYKLANATRRKNKTKTSVGVLPNFVCAGDARYVVCVLWMRAQADILTLLASLITQPTRARTRSPARSSRSHVLVIVQASS